MQQKNHSNNVNRRTAIKTAVGAAGLGAIGSLQANQPQLTQEGQEKTNQSIKQSVCKWCFSRTPLEELAEHAKQIGIQSVELVDSKQWDVLKKHGLICAMSNSHGIAKGLNRIENHESCLSAIRKSIEDTSAAGFPNVICFSGNRKGMDDQEGLENCAIALKQVVGLAEKKNVTICMELLNSARDHKDYMCDRTHWGVELVKKVGSDRFKLLYDIYHMQVQEGNVIDTIRKNKDYIGHYHTAGVPGRNELDENQELFYPAIVRAIVETGYKGYLGQEFIPRKNPLEMLTHAVKLCNV